jgi:hypothetical protein
MRLLFKNKINIFAARNLNFKIIPLVIYYLDPINGLWEMKRGGRLAWCRENNENSDLVAS